MTKDITPKIARNLRALCRRISAEHNLGWEAQKELYSRMKERLFGYVSGEGKLTEEEAFLLMRKHFGEPELVRGLLQEVHTEEAREGFYGRIATLLGVSVMAAFGAEILTRWLFLGITALAPGGELFGRMPVLVLALGDILMPSLLLLAGYNFWRGYNEGRRYWFQNTGPYNILTVIACLVIVPKLLWNTPQADLNAFRAMEYIPHGYTASLALQCLVWLWWCGSPPNWRWSAVFCPLFWVFYETAVYPLLLVLGLLNSPGMIGLDALERGFIYKQIPMLLQIAVVSLVIYLLLNELRMARRKSAEVVVR